MNFNDAELLKNIDVLFDVAKTLTSESVKGNVISRKMHINRTTDAMTVKVYINVKADNKYSQFIVTFDRTQKTTRLQWIQILPYQISTIRSLSDAELETIINRFENENEELRKTQES